MDELDMIDVGLLTPANLSDLKPGQMFIDAKDRNPVLAGVVGDEEVYLRLNGLPFHLAPRDKWPKRNGYLVDGIRFEVHRGDVQIYTDKLDLAPGSLVRFKGGHGIFASDGHNNYWVDLAGSSDSDDPLPKMISFLRWTIVCGEGLTKQTLYTFTGKELLYGAFDPEADEEV